MRTLVVERRFTPRCRPYGDQPALGGARDGGDRGHDVASGGHSTWPGESRAGSPPITARFAAYQEGHVAAIAAGVAVSPRLRAAMRHSESPGRTITAVGGLPVDTGGRTAGITGAGSCPPDDGALIGTSGDGSGAAAAVPASAETGATNTPSPAAPATKRRMVAGSTRQLVRRAQAPSAPGTYASSAAVRPSASQHSTPHNAPVATCAATASAPARRTASCGADSSRTS